MTQVAREEGVSETAIRHRMAKIKAQIKKNFDFLLMGFDFMLIFRLHLWKEVVHDGVFLNPIKNAKKEGQRK